MCKAFLCIGIFQGFQKDKTYQGGIPGHVPQEEIRRGIS